MKTLHTIYTTFAKRLAIVLFFLTTLGLSSAWAATGTLSISTRNGTDYDSQGNPWAITTVGASTSTSHGEYFQIGSSSSPATSITLTMTFPTAQKVTAFSAKFSGYSSNATIILKVGNTVVGEGALTTSHSTNSPVTINSSSVAVGNTLTVSVTNIKNGVNFHNLSYTYESATTQEVTWIVDGQEEKANIPEGTIEVNRLPVDPDNCSSEVVFVGWTANPHVDGNKPADLFNSKTPNSNLPIISSTNNTFYAVYATQTEAPSTKVDALNKAKTGNPSSYTAWSGVTDQSSAVYAGNSSGGNSSIQIKDENNTGIITTQSGGKAKKVVIVWNSNTRDDAKLKIYGKNQAYSSTSELYDTNTQGTLIGTIDRNSTMLEIADDYEYIGMSSLTGAIYLTSISITWESEGSFENYTTTCSVDVTVTLNPNGGTGGDYADWNKEGDKYTQTIEKGNSVTLPTLDDQIAYTFGGWSDGTKTYDAGIYTPEADVELTAIWTAKPLTNFRTLCTYEIVLKNNYVDDDSKDGFATITSTDTKLSISPAPSAREGYEIEGYYLEQGCTTKVADDKGNLVTNVTNYTDADGKWIGGETTLYTKWTGRTYTVTLDDNGGSGGSGTITVTYGSPMPEITLPTRTGYTFNGYWTGKTTQSTQYYDANGNSLKNWDKAGNTTTLYALWTAIHTVTWMVNGNQAEGDPTTSVVNGQTITTLPTTPDVDCNGKVFVGWTTATIHGETATAPDPLYTELGNFPVVTSNMTFNAVFANGSGDEHWVETEINDIEATDEVVVAMLTSDKTYAMSINDEATATPDATVVESSDLTSASGIATGLIWFIEKDGTGKLIIHPKKDIEKNLYCNPSENNDRVRVGKSSNNHESYKTFEIDGNYLKNSVTQHYIGVNFTNYRWYGYANNSNFPDQTLKFYKKTIVYTSYTNYSTSCIDGVCDITNANPIYVTSAVGQKIKATDKLVLTTTDMAVGTEISLSAPNITFYKEGVEITQLTTTAATETFELEIAYQPTNANTTEQPTITLEILGYQFAFDNKITGRSLPAKFVIATKAGATWYALPANMNGATNPAALVVEVDETAMTAVAPNTTPYTLWPVKTTSGSGDRFAQYGDRVRFSAVNNEYKGLWANDAKDANTINNYAKIDEVTDDAAEAYEWKITTTVVDGQWQYTLQSDQPNNQNYLGYRMAQDNPAWGTYASSNNLLYFLPITAETTPFDYKVVEWYPNKLLIHTTTAFSSLTAKIAGEQVANVQYTSKDANQYEVTGLPLIENPAKALTLEFVVADATHTGIHTIPVMLSGGNHSVSTLAIGKGIYNYTDLVVRDGATLTIDGATNTDNTFYDVTIYPTAKISVPEGKQLSVHRMTFLGGISEIYNGATYELNKYGVPQLSLKGTLGKTVTTMDYIMRVNLDQMYQVGVPYDVDLNDITYWDGTKITLGEALYVSAYDGQARANREKKTWIYETNFESKLGSATLKAGVGYTISAEPQAQDDKYSILRMPMKNNIASGNTEGEKRVNVVAYDNEKGVTITDNHKGWNYLSNPYMTTISGGEADSELVLGCLKETGTGPWEWVETTQRYVTIPMDNGKDYYQRKFNEAELKPFKSFFVQIATDGELSFALASRQDAPARLLQQETTPSEIEFELLLSNATQSDNTGLLISEEYTPAYEINADLEKMMSAMSVYTIYNGYNLAYNALSPLNAKEQIPVGYIVPAEGEYTLELDPNSDLDAIKHIYLMDYDMGVTTDLINDAYTFYAADTKSDKRFAINIELSSDIENKPTGFEDVGLEGQRSYKFIYDGILYIMNNGVIYSTTGQQLNTMDK